MLSIKNLNTLVLIVSVLLLSACATKPLVFADFDDRHNFIEAKTFTWVQSPPMLRAGNYPVSGLAEARMTEAIKTELVAKGYQFIDDLDSADFSVIYTMGARDKIELQRYSTRSHYYYNRNDWGWGAYYYPYFIHYPFGRHSDYYEVPSMYTKGTIAIDIFNANTRQPIWHAKASKRLSNRDIDSDGLAAVQVVSEMLSHFPAIGCEPVITPQCQPFKSQ